MRIGIVGSGNMGRSLGVLLAGLGHQVFFGARQQDQARAAAALAGADAAAGSNTDAARFGEMVIWTVRGVAAHEVVPEVDLLAGKPVLDMSNLPAQPEARAQLLTSSAEQLQSALPAAHVVKAFNNFAIELFELAPEPLNAYGISVFLAGDHSPSKSVIADLATSMGCVPVDCGGLENARVLESLGDFSRILIRNGHPFTVALRVVDVPPPATQRLGGRAPSRLP